MKKFALLLVTCALLLTGYAHAATAPTTILSPQNNRMKNCAAQYHAKGIAKSQYRTFMSGCLKNPSGTSAPTTAPAPSTAQATTPATSSQTDKMKSCNTSAKTQNLTGDARKAFMKSCLSGK